MTIPIITRTNTIDEWRIQTNLSAIELNNLKANNYTKTNGTLELANSSVLLISANGTALQVSNSAFIGKDLAITNNVSVGTVGTTVGNVSIGNSVLIGGPGMAVNVSNSVYVGRDVSVVGSVYSNNATINTNASIAGDVDVDGMVTLTGSGKVFEANSGVLYANTAYLTSATLDQANVEMIYALEAKIDNLSDIASAVIGILRVTTGNVYYLTSNTLFANTGTIKDLVVNSSANIVTLSSNVSLINTATIGNLLATNGTIISGNVVTLTSNNATLNTSVLTNTTVTNAAISNAVIASSTTTTGQITNATITNGVITNGNIVSLISDVATLNTSTLLSSNVVSANITNANVSGNLNITNGASLRFNSGSANDALVVESGITSLQSVVVEGNLTVAGVFTQTGNINFETDRFIFNANTTENKDALVISNRVSGNNAQIIWNETNDRWEISTGNTWTDTYKILDGADIYTGIDSDSDTLVASASAVKFAYQAGGVVAGGYANAAYRHANSAYLSQNTTGTYANAAYAHANAAYIQANTPSHVANSGSSYANGAFIVANTANSLAQQAFDAANVAFNAGGQLAYAHANSAHNVANAAFAGTTGTHSNSAYFTANTALTNAAIADQKAVTANANANIAFVHANAAFTFANTTNNYSHAAYTHANAAYAKANTALTATGGTITGDLTIQGTLNASGASIFANDMKIADGIITLNSDILQSASPIENAGLEVDRGASPNVFFIWNETQDKWQLTNDGTNYYNIITSNDLSGGTGYLPITGGTLTGSLTMGSGTNVLLSQAPTNSLHAATKGYVDSIAATLSSLPAQAGNSGKYLTTNGTTASWASFSGTYPISISGSAASATTAQSATTASSATTAGTATNLNGGYIQSPTSYVQYSGTFETFVQGFFRSGGTGQTGAAVRAVGDIAASGDIYCGGLFRGTATSARYADLAEKYLADDEYPEGTVLAIGGEKEVTAATFTDFRALGVVSCKPAFIMNEELEGGTLVALRGRVPVRVIGRIKKGQPIATSETKGVGCFNAINYFALSLEDKDTEEEGVVEAVIL
jgi:hypothetical protein